MNRDRREAAFYFVAGQRQSDSPGKVAGERR